MQAVLAAEHQRQIKDNTEQHTENTAPTGNMREIQHIDIHTRGTRWRRACCKEGAYLFAMAHHVRQQLRSQPVFTSHSLKSHQPANGTHSLTLQLVVSLRLLLTGQTGRQTLHDTCRGWVLLARLFSVQPHTAVHAELPSHESMFLHTSTDGPVVHGGSAGAAGGQARANSFSLVCNTAKDCSRYLLQFCLVLAVFRSPACMCVVHMSERVKR